MLPKRPSLLTPLALLQAGGEPGRQHTGMLTWEHTFLKSRIETPPYYESYIES